MNGTPYISAEDSGLLRMELSGRSGDLALEIGVGNGGSLVGLSKGFRTVVGTDLVRPTMDDWKGAADFILTDGASCMRASAFDLVAFNPPYIKGSDSGDIAVDGGDELTVPKRFLEDALRVVKGSGTVVFLLDGTADIGEFERICAGHGFGMKRLRSQRFFFEVLDVYAATRRT